MKNEARFTWKNVVKNQEIQPLKYYSPTCLNDLKEIIRLAEAENLTVRAVGSGHSFSDVVQTNGFLVNTDELKKVLQIEKNLLNPEVNSNLLVEVEAGIKIHTLNTYLDKNNMALPNMGGFDAQSVAGACSTSTHGSGITLGPLTSFYRSVILVASEGKVYKVEPTKGITNPLKHSEAYPDIILMQNDEWFNTVVVSMGCTGIIYSVVMEMIPKYWILEKRYLSTWEEVKAKLREGKCLTDNRHFEVIVNPYKVKGKNLCLITERNITDEQRTGYRKKGRNFLAKYLGLMPLLLKVLDYFFNTFYEFIPWFINFAMKGLVDKGHINVSYKIFNLGVANYISAYSAELAFPLKNNIYIDAVESMFEVAEKLRKLGKLYHSSPVSLRFVKEYDAYLSMMNGRDTCTVEIPVVNYTYGGFELLHFYENNINKFEGRVHWGQVNTFCSNPLNLKQNYTHFDKWFTVYAQLNSNGTFNNGFTERMGFSI